MTATDGGIDELVRGAGSVAIGASCVDWAVGYLTHAMRGWDDATLNAVMSRPPGAYVAGVQPPLPWSVATHPQYGKIVP